MVMVRYFYLLANTAGQPSSIGVMRCRHHCAVLIICNSLSQSSLLLPSSPPQVFLPSLAAARTLPQPTVAFLKERTRRRRADGRARQQEGGGRRAARERPPLSFFFFFFARQKQQQWRHPRWMMMMVRGQSASQRRSALISSLEVKS